MIHAFWHGFNIGLGLAAAWFVIGSLRAIAIAAITSYAARALVRRVGRIFHRGNHR